MNEPRRSRIADGGQHVGDGARSGAAVHQRLHQRRGALTTAHHFVGGGSAQDFARQHDGTVTLELDQRLTVDHADDVPVPIFHRQMMHTLFFHAQQRLVDQRVFRDFHQRRAHDGVHRRTQIDAGGQYARPQIVIGDDADDRSGVAGDQRRRQLALGHLLS